MQSLDIVIPVHFLPENVLPATIKFKLPGKNEKLDSTQQLVGCLSLLQASRTHHDALEQEARKWLEVIERDTEEQDRLNTMASEMVRAFKRDELKDAKSVAEVVQLGPVLGRNDFRDLLRELYSGIDHSGPLSIHQLEGIAQLIQGGGPGYLDADDLVRILELLSKRLQDSYQSSRHTHQLTLAVSHILDAMADTSVASLDRKTLHDPLSSYLGELRKSSNSYTVYQAAYAYQALLCVPDNEPTWQTAMRSTEKGIKDVSGLESIELNRFIEGLKDIQNGLAGPSNIVHTTYNNVISLAQSGKIFLKNLRNGYSFEHRRDWYSALRGLDVMIRGGKLATFRELVYKAPCRLDPAFQWGVCQRLGEIAANPAWNENIQGHAIAFLGEIYREDDVWGQQASIKQWILNILMQLSSSGAGVQCKCGSSFVRAGHRLCVN